MAPDRIAEYRPPLLMRNRHFSTIITALFRKIRAIDYQRERVDTPDGDFIDLDWSRTPNGTDTLVVLVHGLEGSSDSQYMRGMCLAANEKGWDVVAVNLRNCSGEPNRLYSSYHSGKTDDAGHVLDHLQTRYHYPHIVWVGFSLGANLSLKFAGEQGDRLQGRLKALAAISVPTDLKASAAHLHRFSNRVYLNRFLKSLKRKTREKLERFPGQAGFSLEELRRVRNFTDFDNLYTAPAHGFRDAEDYWERCASGQFIPSIRIPTLIINALDDPFLPPRCYPYEQAQQNPAVLLKTPRYGGHVGFATDLRLRGPCWQEVKTLEFFEEILNP